MPIHFDSTGDHDKFVDVLRKFNLQKLLVKIHRESVKLMMDTNKSLPSGIKCVSYALSKYKSVIRQTMTVYISGWRLIDLAYEAICATNDFRGITKISDDQFYFLCNESELVQQKKEKVFLDKISEDERNLFKFYLWGFSGEQFKFEIPGKAMLNAARELYILFESSKAVENIDNMQNVVLAEIGVTWEKVITTLFLIWGGSTITPYIAETKRSIIFGDTLTEADFDKVLLRYTTDYQSVKESPLGRQILYTKPYIRTSDNQVTSINCFLNLFLYEHSILWIIRDYYRLKQNGNQIFTSKFGECFESYFRELLHTYLSESSFRKIPEEKVRRADWEIITDDYKFLIEQKSALIGLLAKQQASDIDVTSSFVKNNIIKAIKQLNKTEEDFANGKYIKIILLYDDYLQPEILSAVFQMKECTVENDGYYWIVTINEMEMLLDLYQKDRRSFKNVVKTKLQRDSENSNLGRDILMILNEQGITVNNYLSLKKFNYYANIAKATSIQHLKS